MRVLIDTNVLFSAALNPNGTPFQAYVKAVTPPNTGIICRQNIEELRTLSGIRQSGNAAEYRHHLSAEHRRTAKNI